MRRNPKRNLVPFLLFLLVGSLAREAAAEEGVGRPPTLFVSTDWSVLARPEYNEDFEKNFPAPAGTGGLTLTLRQTGRNHLWYGEAKALFVGGVYGGRVGLLLGAHVEDTYSETLEFSQSTVGNVQYTHSKVATYGTKVGGVFGLDLGVSGFASDGSGGLVLEAGIAYVAQSSYELSATYDVVHGAPGARMSIVIMEGRDGGDAFNGGVRVSAEFFFDDDMPLSILCTVGLGFGSGFHTGSR